MYWVVCLLSGRFVSCVVGGLFVMEWFVSCVVGGLFVMLILFLV